MGNPDLDSPKALQILAGARAAFLDLGFEGASVDEIARRARVSKGTLYNYFPDKRALFRAVIERECQEQAERTFSIEESQKPVQEALRGIARKYVEFLISPFAMGLFRIAVAESPRFPHLGRVFWDSGPDLGTRRLAQFLAVAKDRGELDIDDLELAAHQFTELCKARVFYKTLFGVGDPPSPVVRERYADAAADTFVRAYGGSKSS